MKLDKDSRLCSPCCHAADCRPLQAESEPHLLAKCRQLIDAAAAGTSEIAAPTFVSRSAFQGTLLYYGLVHVLRSVGPQEGGAIMVALFVGHGIMAELTGWNLDWTYPVARLGHAISNTPMPELAGQRAAGADAKGTAAGKRKSKTGASASSSSQDLSKPARQASNVGKAEAKQA